ncbi:hypothetical protein GYMLUDRAFT_241594 [Collybiopsis luxurians FD-317 M1]|uniref:Uncharacterized protein n=1 Tax=Collybiopsis luxurians FD-317 M1 TaxID=944289 RepID=A0A0D0CVH1_9AGAR|nr:hypothetical protein GYMLUDRAFT_241594 [Collybiopsis luxurians FD-317 M1]
MADTDAQQHEDPHFHTLSSFHDLGCITIGHSQESITFPRRPEITFTHETDCLPLFDVYIGFINGFRDKDASDVFAKRCICIADDNRTYVEGIHRRTKILPGKFELVLLARQAVPSRFVDFLIFEINHEDILEDAVGPGTFILAGDSNQHGMVIAHLLQCGNYHYVVCLHSSLDFFLLKVHDNALARNWVYWADIGKLYKKTTFSVLFAKEANTLEAKLSNLRNFSRTGRSNTTVNEAIEGHGLWNTLRNFFSHLQRHNDEEVEESENTHWDF